MEPGIKINESFLKYVIRREVGRGGMGIVFEAWDEDLHRQVALKVLHPRLLVNSAHGHRIVAEARAAASLHHPNIVRVHTLLEHQGITVIDMEYVEGRSLEAVLATGPLGLTRTISIFTQILLALDACHKKGMVHLDLKPSNILVTPEGHVFLTDFGLSQAIAGLENRTEREGLWGTPRYAPPELWSGARPTATWDVYSAGVVVCECLQGRGQHALPIGNAADMERYAERLVNAITGVSPELSALLARMLAKKPGDRPSNAGEALGLLRVTPEFQQAAPKTENTSLPNAIGETVPIKPTPPTNRNRWKVIAAVLAIVAAISAAVFALNERSRPALPDLEQRGPMAISQAGSSNPMALTLVKNVLYFTADTDKSGRELWAATARGPHRVAEGRSSDFTLPRALFAASDRLYFTAELPQRGAELFQTTMLESGESVVSLVRDILPGPMGSDPECVAFHWPITLFYATTRQEGRELWTTFGTEPQTGIASDLLAGPQGSAPDRPRVSTGKNLAYIVAFTHLATGLGLCYYDFANNTTHVICDVSEDVGLLGVIDERLVFTQSDAEHGNEVWIADAASGEVRLLMDISPGVDSSNASNSCVIGNRVLFQATTPSTGAELWITDGTTDGTRLLRDIRPGPEGSAPYALKSNERFAAIRADDGVHGMELWASDGTEEGTMMIADVCPGNTGSNPYNNIPHETFIAFSANDGVHGEELWLARFKSGRWSADMVKDIAPGAANAEPYELIWTDETHAYFVATDPAIGRELFQLTVHMDPRSSKVTAFDLSQNAPELKNDTP